MSRALLTQEQVAEIVQVYDGSSAKIDQLVAKFGVQRHNVIRAAVANGYKRKYPRVQWTTTMDKYLRDNWGLVAVDDICKHLNCTVAAIQNRKKRLGLSSWAKAEEIGYNILELERLTKLDHRLWLRYIDAGELRCTTMATFSKKNVMRVVSIEHLHAFLRRRPCFLNLDKVGLEGRAALELFNLPEPPKFKQVVCTSSANASRMMNACISGPYHHGDIEHRAVVTRGTEIACSESPFAFWAPIFEEHPNCPRCGSVVSRFSPDRVYLDQDPGEGEVLQMLAGKIGLQYHDGKIVDASGHQVSEQDLLAYAFAQKRDPKIAFRVFSHLIQRGLTPAVKRPARTGDWLQASGVDYALRGRQIEELERLKRDSNICVTWPPGEGKMFFLAFLFGMVPGDHAVFVNSTTLAEQWADFLQRHWRGKVKIRWSNKPSGIKVRLWGPNDLHARVDIWSYMTRHDFATERYRVVGYDEAHFLPGTSAHRLAMLGSELRVGLTATPYREDGRASLIGLLTGDAGQETWAEVLADRTRPRAAIEVVLVDDLEHKYRAVEALLPSSGKGLVFVEAIEDGRRLAAALGVPFVFSETKDRMNVIEGNRVSICSRVADHGLDLQDLEWLIEFGFQKGSRSQQLQRHGRLLHSDQAQRHTIMMTRKELSLYSKRLSALEQQGIHFTMRVAA